MDGEEFQQPIDTKSEVFKNNPKLRRFDSVTDGE